MLMDSFIKTDMISIRNYFELVRIMLWGRKICLLRLGYIWLRIFVARKL